MELTYDIIKDLATEGLIIKYGEARGNAIAFIFFGKFGLLGLADVAVLVTKANDSKNENGELPAEMAANLVMDLVSELTVFALSKAGVTIFEQFANPLTFLNILFSPTKLGNGELPIELKPDLNNNNDTEDKGGQDQGGEQDEGGGLYDGGGQDGDNGEVGGQYDGGEQEGAGEQEGDGGEQEGDGGDYMEVGTKDAETGETIEPTEPYGPEVGEVGEEEDGDDNGGDDNGDDDGGDDNGGEDDGGGDNGGDDNGGDDDGGGDDGGDDNGGGDGGWSYKLKEARKK